MLVMIVEVKGGKKLCRLEDQDIKVKETEEKNEEVLKEPIEELLRKLVLSVEESQRTSVSFRCSCHEQLVK